MKIFLILLLLSFEVIGAECPNTDFNMSYLPIAKTENIYCYEQYVMSYDLKNKTAIFVGEHLGKGEIFWRKRVNSFHKNKEIPEESRTTLEDYSEPQYDRGHLAPSGDMTSAKNEKESFLMSNMVPQTKELNRGIWKKIEESLRKESETNELIIITGPIYSSSNIYIGNKVPVPTSTFKWIYNLTNNTERGYIVQNRHKFNSNLIDSYLVSKDEIQRQSNIKMSK